MSDLAHGTRKSRIIAIVGANASGKSDLGILLARTSGGEILSADSRQVYRGLNLGTGKVQGITVTSSGRTESALGREFFLAPRESEGILHWLIDIVEPEQFFTVAEYQKLACGCIRDILNRGRLPILVGGTGLYVRAVVEGLHFPGTACRQNAPRPAGGLNGESLRASLELKSPEELRAMLLACDPDAGSVVDLKNPRRMARALEVHLSTGEPLTVMRRKIPVFFDTLTIGIAIARDDLKDRIRARLTRRLDLGMVAEVEGLLTRGVTGERMESFGLEYRYIYRFLSGQLPYEEMVEQLFRAICRFAKRQFTWFRKYGDVHWISDWDEAKSMVDCFIGP